MSYNSILSGTNQNLIFIGFLGNFTYEPVTPLMLKIFWALMDLGLKDNYIAKDFKVFMECQHLSGYKESPGKHFQEIVPTWIQWDNYSANFILRECK